MRVPVAIVVTLLAVAAYAPAAVAQSAGPDFDVPNGHFYTQTNGSQGSGLGYRISNDGGVAFWSEFQRLGGVTLLGYPASRRFMLDGYVAQVTQKVILQWRPDVRQAYFVNTFDKLHDLGLDATLQTTYQIPPQLDASFDVGKTPDQDQAARLALLNADPAIAGSYGVGTPGLSLSLLYAGLPTSAVTNEGPFTAVRAQRVVFQHWTSDGPGGIKAGTLEVVNGGDVAKAVGLVPQSAQAPEPV